MKIRIFFYFLSLFYLVSCQEQPAATGPEADEKTGQISVPEGFELEELYRPSDHNQGTWVALAEGENGIFYASDQKGDLYRFKMPPVGEVLDSTQVDSVDLDIGRAHGLLWAFNSLYVSVNRNWPDEDDETVDEEVRGSGVYRLQDLDGDGKLDDIQMLLQLEGAGEHGPHSMIVGPEGDELYFIAGNHTDVPKALAGNSRLPSNWGEDNLFPAFVDARGHANDRMAPGGWIARTDPEGKEWELMSAGFRNAFDIAFNEEGELFAFDADMEWDFGMPWYRPIRIVHATSGSEFGWRTGSGKWPDYYPDNLPAVVNLGQGSPTALLMGTQLDFPAKYKQGLFAFDWSFGTMYFIDLQAQGSSYTGQLEEFLWGTPLPLTDGIAGSDGAMYFATGGRDLESQLYRLRYTGSDPANARLTSSGNEKEWRAIRRSLEVYHQPGAGDEAIKAAWAQLGHDDRFIRYAARIALEHQPTGSWQDKFFAASDPDKIITAGLALARQGKASIQSRLISKLNTLDWEALNKRQQIDLARVTQLSLIRMGQPNQASRAQLIKSWSNRFPASDYQLDREISQLLVFLKAEDAVAKTVALLEKHTREKTITHPEMLKSEISGRSEQYGPNVEKVLEKMPPTEATYYGTLLAHASSGWTKTLREKYFRWYYDILAAEGGLSFKAFLEDIRQEAMTHVPADQKEYFENISGVYSPMAELAKLPQPEGPGADYNISDISRITRRGLEKDFTGDLEKGGRVYQAALCFSCHRMRGEGGISGPDLTQIHTRFERMEIANAIFSPHDAISDQYAFTLFELKGDKRIAGKIKSENEERIILMPNPFSSTHTVEVAKTEVLNRGLSPVSPMPPGLLNRLNESEITELFAYLLSGADPDHVYYGGTKGFRVEDEKEVYKKRKEEKEKEEQASK